MGAAGSVRSARSAASPAAAAANDLKAAVPLMMAQGVLQEASEEGLAEAKRGGGGGVGGVSEAVREVGPGRLPFLTK